MRNGGTMPKLYSVKQFAQENPAFSESSLRWMLFNSDANGLLKSGAIIRNGRRILIDSDKFFAWLQANQPRVA